MAKETKPAKPANNNCVKCDGTGAIDFGPICQACQGAGKIPVMSESEAETADEDKAAE